MFLLLLMFVGHALSNETALLQCDFETFCNDFSIDGNWGFTDGFHPRPLDYDHTFRNHSGHYIFYAPQSYPPYYQIEAQIKTSNWLDLSMDEPVCFRMWYYTPRLSLPFTIEIVQGDDEQLTRILASVEGKDPAINDWTLINLSLPAEKFKIIIQLNVSARPLVFDDLSVEYCDEPRPSPTKILYECDFESSCANEWISLPDYDYRWSMMAASDAIKIESQAPTIDYTFKNQSGHYVFIADTNLSNTADLGYIALSTSFNMTTDESYCLNFQYYRYGRSNTNHLRVYAQLTSSADTMQLLWPSPLFSYGYVQFHIE
jgi:hypothetical protein